MNMLILTSTIFSLPRATATASDDVVVADEEDKSLVTLHL